MSPLWKWYLPGYVMALPLTLIGILLALYYRPGRATLHSGCIEFILKDDKYLIGGEWVGGQTFGNAIFYRDERSWSYGKLRGHERVHTWQAMMFSGPLFAAFYGLDFFIRWAAGGFDDWERAYRTSLSEQQAYGVGGRIKSGELTEYWGKL